MKKEALQKENNNLNKPLHCPKCGSVNVTKIHASTMDLHLCECQDCKHKFYVEEE